ncbi:MAG: glucodextranase DOMON-like domain-containing protein [Acidobacteriota bacterium]
MSNHLQSVAARVAVAALLALALIAVPVAAEKLEFKDPTGDDNGPGEYVYPTDAVYNPGSFDLTGLSVKTKGKNVDFSVDLNTRLEDPWNMGTGFSVQMIFIFIDTDGEEGSGNTETLPGLNVEFAPYHAWDKVVILSPQGASRVKTEVEQKVADLAGDIVIPGRVKGVNRSISARVKLEELGGGDPSTWGYQVLVQSNEGFPSGGDLLTRKVNEFEGQHRFGGGNDYDCDPHVVDILAGSGSGSDDEVAAQHAQLAYECDAEGNASKRATLTTVRKSAD